MANEIEIRVKATDATAQGLDSATKRIQGVAAAAAGGSGSAADSLAKADKAASGLGGSLKRVGEVAAGVLAADALQAGARQAISWMRQSVTAASDLGESVNAVNKVFERASEQVQEWGRRNANALGLSTRAFNQMAVPLGSMLKNQGLSMQDVTKHTIMLTERSADMAWVFNTDVADALAAVQAGLRGEQDPLERYGVSLSAAAVEARALADTGKESAAALTSQEKALARLNLIYDQTKDTAGDFRDTSDGLANAQRIAAATMEEAQAKIGQAFIPIMAKGAEMTGNFVGAITALPPPVLLAAGAIAALGAATLLLAPRIVATRQALDEMATSDSRVQRSMARTATVVGKAGGALAAFTVAAQVIGSVMDTRLNPQVDAFTEGLSDWTKTGQLAGESARLLGDDADKLDQTLRNATSSSFGFGKWIESWISPLQAADQSATKVQERMTALDDSLVQLVQSGRGDEAAKIFQMLADRGVASVEELQAALPGYVGAVEVAAKGTTGLGSAAAGAARDIDQLDKELDQLINKTFSLEEAEDALADAVQQLRDQIKGQKEDGDKGAGTLDRNTQAGRDNADAVRELVRLYEDLMIEYDKAGQSTDGLRQQLEDQLVAMGFSRDEAKRYAASLGEVQAALEAIPKVTTITVKSETEKALAQLRETEREARRMYADPIYVHVKMAPTMAGPPGTGFARASGGIQGAASGGVRGGMSWVGEHGPELVRLPYGSQVIPAGTSREMARSGGGGGGRYVLDLMLNGRHIREILIDDGLARGKSTVDLAAAYP